MVSQEQPLEYYWSSILWLFLAPAVGGYLFGYDIGGTSFAIVQLASEEYESSPLSLSDAPLKTGWFVSAPSVGALLGTAFIIYVENYQKQSEIDGKTSKSSWNWQKIRNALIPAAIGRRDELRYAGILYFLGGLIQFAASVVANREGDNVNWLLPFAIVSVGRWIYGAAIGFAMHGGPTYLAETTPPNVRGMVVGAKEIAIVVGILSGYWVGDHFCSAMGTIDENQTDGTSSFLYPNGWAQVYGCTMLGAIAMILFSSIIPESPRYMASTSEENKSKDISSDVLESLKFVWKPKRAEEEHRRLMDLLVTQNDQKSGECDKESLRSSSSVASLFSDPSFKPALKAGLGLVILQQITGQPSVLSYATPILAKVPSLSSNASVFLALFKVVATSVSVVLVERNGRKILLTIGCSLMLAALMVLSVAFREESSSNDADTIEDDNDSTIDAKSLFVIGGMFAYIAGYQIGFGPISWLMISEVFPQSIRGTAVALAVQTNFALNAVVQFLVPVLRSEIGLSSTFLLFGCLTAYSLWFIEQSVPETKGLTLEEIEDELLLLAAKNEGVKMEMNSNLNNEGPQQNDERTLLLSPA